MHTNPEIREIRDHVNEIASHVTAIHPMVSKLKDAPTEGVIFKALFELTKHVEVIKKHLLRLEQRDDSAAL